MWDLQFDLGKLGSVKTEIKEASENYKKEKLNWHTQYVPQKLISESDFIAKFSTGENISKTVTCINKLRMIVEILEM